MPIMSTLRFQRNTSLPMRWAHQTRPGNDTTHQSCFWKIQSTLLPCFFRCFKVWNTALTCGRRTTTRRSPIQRRIHLYLRGVNEDRQAAPSTTHKDQCTKKQRLHWLICKKQSRQDLGIPFIPIRDRKRLHNQIDPALQGYLEWLSTNWEEREPPTSSSSSHWSSHPGGAHSRGLRTGKDGINTVWTVTNGQNLGKKEHWFVLETKLIASSGNWWQFRLQEDTSEVVIDKNEKIWLPSTCFFIVFRIRSDATHWTRRGVYTEHLTGRAHTHFSRARVTSLMRTPHGSSVSGVKSPRHSRTHFHLVPWCRCWTSRSSAYLNPCK